MFEPIRYAIYLSPAIISASLILSSMTSAIAGEPAWQNGQTPFDSSISEQFTPYSQNNTPTSLPQVTNVTQLRDVSPQAWYFEALKNLTNNYGCIQGYPDGTYRGNNSLSRGEFAAGMNSCLQAVESRILSETQAMKTQGTPANTTSYPAKSSGRSLSETFNRAFNNDTGRFYDITNISGQLNQIFGWRTFMRGSFFDNQIANDGKTVETVYSDAIRQQTAGPRMVSRDLPNPFDTSLSENPSYSGTTPPPYYP